MNQFKLLSEDEILPCLTDIEISKLKEFQHYLFEARKPLHSDACQPSLGETYNTAWILNFVDFQTGMTNLYGIDYGLETMKYAQLCRMGLDGTAQIGWFTKFGDELELPTHPSFWAKK